MPGQRTQALTHLEGWELEALPPIRIKNGIPTDADFFGIPRNGFMVWDSSSPNTLWVRSSGVWQPIASGSIQTTFTASVNVTNVVEASSDTIVTAPAITCDGVTDIEVRVYAPDFRPDGTAVSRSITVCLFEDGASIGHIAFSSTPAAINDYKPLDAVVRFTPTAGSHTYSARAFVNAGTGVVDAGTGGSGKNQPGYISVRRISS